MAGTDLHERVLEQIGQSIVSGDLPSGEVFTIEELEGRFGVSRSVIREALRVLISMNLIESRRSVGVTVLSEERWNPFDPRIIRWRLAGPDRLSQLHSFGELRLGVEPEAAALAAERALPSHCADLTRAVMGMAATGRAGELDAYLEFDVDFHRTLLKASGNAMFASLSDVVAAVLAGRTEHKLMPHFPKPSAIALHLDVANAVQARDAASARTAMRAILTEASHAISETKA